MTNVTKARIHRLEEAEQEYTEEEMVNKNRLLDSELSLSRSLITEELYMSQLNLDYLPPAMGDTLFLQVSLPCLSHHSRLVALTCQEVSMHEE